MGSRRERRRGSATPDRSGREHGFTLLEVLIAVNLLGLVVVGMTGTIITAVRISGVEHRRALVQTEGQRVAEVLRIAAYEPCGLAPTTYASRIDDASGAEGVPGVAVAVDRVEYWLPDDDDGGGGIDAGRFEPLAVVAAAPDPRSPGSRYCAAGNLQDAGIQRVRFGVTVGDARDTFTIVKRRDL